MKKAISMMLATAMAATCLAGCGSAASSSAAASSEAASSEATSTATSEASTGEKTFENNELNIAVFEGGYGSEYWDEIIKRFEAAYPGVTVNMQISPKIGDIIRPQIVAGNVPDFISMNDNDSTGLISSMVKEHALMDLSDVFEEGGIDDDTPLKDQVIDGLLDSAKCSPYGDGKIYIAPFDASPMGLVYNKTLFEENGWETPVTWDDFFELGEKAKEKGIALFTYQGIYPGYLESMANWNRPLPVCLQKNCMPIPATKSWQSILCSSCWLCVSRTRNCCKRLRRSFLCRICLRLCWGPSRSANAALRPPARCWTPAQGSGAEKCWPPTACRKTASHPLLPAAR